MGASFLSLSSLGLILFGLSHSLISVSLISLGLKRIVSCSFTGSETEGVCVSRVRVIGLGSGLGLGLGF